MPPETLETITILLDPQTAGLLRSLALALDLTPDDLAQMAFREGVRKLYETN